MRSHLRSLVAAGLVGSAVSAANATWSILIVDTSTGEIGVASATCLIGLDLRELTPLLITQVGGLTAQSYGDSTGQNRTFIRDRLLEGVAPDQIINLVGEFDSGHQTRQYGLLDAQGGVATFTGSMAGSWAGGVVGQTGDFVYAVQGNVLTGEPVVALAEQAIISTPGDLPEKLMAAMEAAYSMGGDGRCSCNASLPESCGSPPPSFNKSAHVGYMLVARSGDFSAANGVYGMPDAPGAIAVTDFDADGRPDVVATTEFDGEIVLMRNVTPPGSAFSRLQPIDQLPGMQQPVGLVVHDVNADGFDDLLIATRGGSNIRCFAGDGLGGFTLLVDQTFAPLANGVDFQLGLGGLVVAAGQSISVLSATPDFAEQASTTFAASVRSFAADPVDPNASYVVDATGQVTRVIRTGDVLTQEPVFALGVDAVSIAAADFNADARTDLFIVSTASQRADILIDDGLGGWTHQSFNLGRLGRDSMIADFDNDGDLDAAALTHGRANLQIFRNDSGGTFTHLPEAPITRAPRVGVAADLNADGYADVVTGSAEANGLVIADNFAGRFATTLGTAAGDYFMQLNVANATSGMPDPVLLLRDQFDAWRADLVGKVDAVQSSTQIDAMALPVNSSREALLNITLRDWQGDLVTDDVNLTVTLAPGSAGAAVIGAIDSLGNGQYRAHITAGAAPGVDTLIVTADAGDRGVQLMPGVSFRVIDASGDFDADGVISFYDVQAFLRAFSAGDLSADLTGDGTLDINDVQLFLELLAG